MINCIILDDEPLAIKVIQSFIKKTDYLNCIGTFSNAPLSLPFLKKNKIGFNEKHRELVSEGHWINKYN